jgi:hypothetical protein
MEYVIRPEEGVRFQNFVDFMRNELAVHHPVNRMEWQKLDVSRSPLHYVHEKLNVTVRMDCPETRDDAQKTVQPELPWAEEHFMERVSGYAYNPPPSYTKWPHHVGDPGRHTTDTGLFDHTYPERFWPAYDNEILDAGQIAPRRRGIRFAYGDLQDVIELLQKSPMTRQAYLPIWFPEDTGVIENQRVPCTLGYHFQRDTRTGRLNITYMIRSCDIIRHFRNDVYMAIRLLQWVCDETTSYPGELVMHIMNLHMMVGDSNKP